MVIVWIFAVLLILYLVLLLLLRCRKGNETWAKLKPQRYAHRGYHDKPTIPENSMPAFRRAIEHGWGAELDTSDSTAPSCRRKAPGESYADCP